MYSDCWLLLILVGNSVVCILSTKVDEAREEWVRRDSGGVKNETHMTLCTSDGHVRSAIFLQEADLPCAIGSNHADDDCFLLASLKIVAISRLHSKKLHG